MRRLMVLPMLLALAAEAQEVTVKPGDSETIRNEAEGAAAADDIVLSDAIDITLPVPGKYANSFDDAIGFTFSNVGMKHYVIDKARVILLSLHAERKGKSRINVRLSAMLTTEWYRQDVDLILELRDAERDLALYAESWDDITIGSGKGPYSGGTRTPRATWKLKKDEAAQFRELLEADRLEVRCRMAIDDD